MKKISSYKRQSLSIKTAPYLFVLPNFLIFTIFIVIPAIYGVICSFTDYDGLSALNFIGARNYIKLFGNKEFWQVMLKTGIYSAWVIPSIFIIGLLLAMLLISDIKGKGIFRAVFYWPVMISAIIVGLIWKWLLGENFGVTNFVLGILGHDPVKWISDPVNSNISVIAATVWSRIGFFMVIFMSGLQSIPVTYYEAAKIDGASRINEFWKITFPLLKPTSVMVLILTLIESFKAYPLIFSLTGGGPGKATTYIVQYIYQYGFTRSELGYASAMSVVLFAVIGLFTIIQFKLTKGGRIV